MREREDEKEKKKEENGERGWTQLNAERIVRTGINAKAHAGSKHGGGSLGCAGLDARMEGGSRGRGSCCVVEHNGTMAVYTGERMEGGGG